ncbi:MAG: prepilin-type N-terminal cleavage/methylation domain-containing protein, partial [Candidatus Omnitrophota bacterium]
MKDLMSYIFQSKFCIILPEMVVSKRGFTLLEVLMVVIIIGVLATLAIPQYTKTVEKARAAEAYSNLGTIRKAE